MLYRTIFGAALAAVLVASAMLWRAPSLAEEMAGMVMDPKGNKGPSSMAYAHAMMTMHSAMDITYSGDADADFAKGMIPHHQGAIDMARVVLKFGNDPELRKLAEGVVAAQKAEVAQMQAWLEAHGQ